MKYEITSKENNQRFDRFVRKYLDRYDDIGLGSIYKWIRNGKIKVNNSTKSKDYRLVKGDMVVFDSKTTKKLNSKDLDEKPSLDLDIDIDEISKQIVYEDDNRIFWNKPSDMVVHGQGSQNTLNKLLEYYLANHPEYQNDSPTFKPSFGFRLDKDTTGLIVASKTYKGIKYINKIIRNRQVQKHYLAVVKGDFPDKMTIDKPIFKGYNNTRNKSQGFVNYNKGKKAISKVRKIKTYNQKYLGKISLLKVQLITGRMHQIRVHLANEGYRILGDSLYGKRSINQNLRKHYNISRQMLHSWRYGFYDEYSHLFLIKNAPIRNDMARIIDQETLDDQTNKILTLE